MPTTVPAALPSNLLHRLRGWAASQPARPAYSFLTRGETLGGSLTFAQLLERVESVAAGLIQAGVEPGDRLVLAYPSGLEFVVAFLGCLEAGAIAVPCPLPHHPSGMGRLAHIHQDCEARAALTSAAHLPNLSSHLPKLTWLATDTMTGPGPGAPRDPAPSDVALLQYTSGSTSDPRGVMVTHANLSANEEAMAEAFRTSSRSVFVSWLPLFHDMGLIGVVLHALHVGAHAVLMAPLDFAQKPLRWLKAVTTWKATFTGAPNFAYDLCIKKATPESLAGLDLSGLLTAFNGSEPIHAATLERFTRAFAPVGFESRMFYPCYGLAEATLFVTGGDLGAPPLVTGDDPPRVGCGRTWGDHEVLVVDPETRQPVPAGATGEVWVAGPSVAQGYWRHPEETARTFDAVRADSGRGGYLRTGDMGLLDRDELVITGRIKDLLIMEGRNLYPQDLERTIQEAHPSIRETCVAAFSIERDGRERLIVAAEVTRGLPDAEAEALKVAVKEAVSLHHQALLGDLVLLAHGTLPKTSSGKVRRQACRDAYLSGAWSVARP